MSKAEIKCSIRNHSAFLNSYTPEDETLYDDIINSSKDSET